MRQLTPCENQGKHHIFVKVEDAAGQGINGVPVKVEWSPVVDGHVLINTETKTDLVGQLDPGRFDGQRAFGEMSRFLEVGPRVAGTPGARAAAD